MNAKSPNKTYTSFENLKIHGRDSDFRTYEIEEVFSTQSQKGQDIKILKLSNDVGLCLSLNDDLMALQCNQDFLHKHMVQLGASNLKHHARNITILGGGDGGVLKQCLKLKPRTIKLLELDKEVVSICKKYLPHISEGSLEHDKVKIIYGDAFETIKKVRKNSQHLVFIDMADAATIESNQVFGSKSDNLFLSIKRCLKDDGVVVAQASVSQQKVLSAFKKYFKHSYGWTDNFDLNSANSFVYAIKT